MAEAHMYLPRVRHQNFLNRVCIAYQLMVNKQQIHVYGVGEQCLHTLFVYEYKLSCTHSN